jgi:tRNA threonylcarbamoyladenosine biosynthesis protein TsaE
MCYSNGHGFCSGLRYKIGKIEVNSLSLLEFHSGEGNLSQNLPLILPYLSEYKIWGLRGQLGAGKTSLIKNICKALGADDVSSPSFSLINEYACDGRFLGITKLIHMDLYRLNNLDQALEMGIEEYLYGKEVVMIEWPEIIVPLLDKEKVLYLDILFIDDQTRQYRLIG